MTIEIPILEVTNGNQLAADWLAKWCLYCHGIDDLVDQKQGTEELLGTLAAAVELYSHPFFIAHSSHLRPLVVSITNAYADSVAWEGSHDPAQRAMADHLRLAGVEMYCLVAGLCGGYSHMRRLSPRIRLQTWAANHDRAGNPH